MSGLVVYKANSLVVSRYDLSEQETKLILYGVAKLNPNIKAPSKAERTVVIPYTDYAKAMNMSDSQAWTNLNNAISNLMSRTIEIVNPDPRFPIEKVIFQWVNNAEFNRETQSVELVFSDEIQPYLFDLKEFIKYKLDNVKSLNNKYSVQLYEMLLKSLGESKCNRKDVLFSLDEFKNLLMLDNNYPDYRELNRRVLKVAVNDINKNSDLKVKLTTKGRPVNLLIFTVEKIKQIELIEDEPVKPKRKTHQEKIDKERYEKTEIILNDHNNARIALQPKELDLLRNMYKHYHEQGNFNLQGKITDKVIVFFDKVLNKYLPRMPSRR